MGLDQYGYSKDSNGNKTDLQYWRKHSALEGWMQDLYRYKGKSGNGNGKDFELVSSDIDRLEEDVSLRQLPYTTYFFLGDNSRESDLNFERDVNFVNAARKEIEKGNRVFYSSNW